MTGSRRKIRNFTAPKKSHPPVGPPIAPALPSRVPVFQPTFKSAKPGPWTHETAWGKVTVEGRLTGIHRKVLDAIFGSCIESKRLATGALAMLVDPYKIEKLAGIAKNPKWLRTLLEDMRVVKVTIETRDGGKWYQAGIVSEFGVSAREADDGREQWLVTISAAWMNIFDTSLVVRYRELLPLLAQLRSGPVYAVALHVLTHGEGYFDVADLFRRVMAWPAETLKPESFKRAVRRLFEAIDCETTILGQLGISTYIKDGKQMIHYVPPLGVGVQKALPSGTRW